MSDFGKREKPDANGAKARSPRRSPSRAVARSVSPNKGSLREEEGEEDDDGGGGMMPDVDLWDLDLTWPRKATEQDWQRDVQSIGTVERDETGTLYVYAQL